MQLRCYQCHKPFAIGKEAIKLALDMMEEQGLHHYNAQCPHCRRVNRVSRKELMRSAPDWSPKKERASE